MNAKEMLAMLVPNWLRHATETLPPRKDLRAEFKKLGKEINDETQEIQLICEEHRRTSQPPFASNGHSG